MAFIVLWASLSALGAEDWVLPDSIRKATIESQNMAVGERMQAVSQPFLGLPYVLDPMGESVGVDPDPLIRYDAFDCLTFVEEVWLSPFLSHRIQLVKTD